MIKLSGRVCVLHLFAFVRKALRKLVSSYRLLIQINESDYKTFEGWSIAFS